MEYLVSFSVVWHIVRHLCLWLIDEKSITEGVTFALSDRGSFQALLLYVSPRHLAVIKKVPPARPVMSLSYSPPTKQGKCCTPLALPGCLPRSFKRRVPSSLFHYQCDDWDRNVIWLRFAAAAVLYCCTGPFSPSILYMYILRHQDWYSALDVYIL